MGRPEHPIDPPTGPLADFATELRTLRQTGGAPSYRMMARLTHYSAASLARAAGGAALPSWDITLAYVTACGGDPDQWSRRWNRTRALLAAAPPTSTGPVVPPPPAGALDQPAQLPAPVSHFVGRHDELTRLSAATADPASPGVVIISGMAGVGKTALAVRWAYDALARYPDGQLFIDLRTYATRTPVTAIEALARFLRALGVPGDRVPADVDEAAALYRSRMAGRRRLVILDNAGSADQVRPLLPGTPAGVVLVTSRDQLSGLVALQGADRVDLAPLDRAAAVDLLTRTVGPHTTAGPAVLESLAAACAHLPLALRIAGANLRPDGGRLAAMVGRPEADWLSALRTPGDPQATVRSAFELSYARQAPAAQRLFRLLALAPGRDIGVPAAAALAGHSPTACAGTLAGLVDASLVTPEPADRFGLHDLLRRYAVERAGSDDRPADRDAAVDRLTGWYVRRADAAARVLYPQMLRLCDPADPIDPPTAFDDPAAALAWLDAERDNLVSLVRDPADRPAAAAGAIADALRGYAWMRGPSTDWLTIGTAALDATVGDPRARTMAWLFQADAHFIAGAADEAMRGYAEALAAAHRSGWTEAQASIHSNLGGLTHEMGRPAEAVVHHRRALEICERTGYQRIAPTVHNNLGRAYTDLGRSRAARDHLRTALALYAALDPPRRPAVGLHNLGISEHMLSRFDDARDHLAEAAALHEASGNRVGELDARANLAAVLLDIGDIAAATAQARLAMNLADESVQTDQSVRGDESVRADAKAKARSAYAAVLHHTGAFRDAAHQYRRCLSFADRDDTSLRIVAHLGLARAHHRLGHRRSAREHGEHALSLALAADFHRFTGPAHDVIADVHLAAGRPAEAVEHARAALAGHLTTGCRLDQAAAHRRLGRLLLATSPGRARLHLEAAGRLYGRLPMTRSR